MLKKWTTHAEYGSFVIHAIRALDASSLKRLSLFDDSLKKLALLNLDGLGEKLRSYYSATGRPAELQPEIFRSFMLMADQGETSVTNWVKTLAADDMLCFLIGCTPEHLPSLGAYYDFISRLWLLKPSIEKENREELHPYGRKKKREVQPGKNKKLPNKRPGIVGRIANLFRKGRSFSNRPERLMQEIFTLLAVNPSVEAGLLPEDDLTVSGDGTCIHCHSSPHGIKVCNCRENGIYDCKCDRKFADPDATHGWDSDLGTWYYGYTLYPISCYNKELQIDLPFYWRFVGANRHDSVTGLVALTEFRELSPNLNIKNLCLDSANDNYPTYQLLNEWGIHPFIDLSDRTGPKNTYPSHISVTDKGAPICMGGHEMLYHGFCPDRSRLKWRCPLACGKIPDCCSKPDCSASSYGRVIYTKPAWDIRIFTPVPRGTPEWKGVYKARTSSERINNRFLHDYHLEDMRVRGKKRYSFFSLIFGINIHLDARVKVQKLPA